MSRRISSRTTIWTRANWKFFTLTPVTFQIVHWFLEGKRKTRRLLSLNSSPSFSCSLDPILIQIPSQSSTTHLNRRSAFFFYLYNLFKEPIPFEIHCHLRKSSSPIRNCSSMDEDLLYQDKSSKQGEDTSPILYRSARVDVFRRFPTNFHPPGKTSKPLPDRFCPLHFLRFSPFRFTFASIVTVHRSQCFFHFLDLFLLSIIVIFHNMQLEIDTHRSEHTRNGGIFVFLIAID